MKVRGVDFIAYNISDYKRSVKFYRDVLGLPLASEYMGAWAEFAAGPSTVAIIAPEFHGDKNIGKKGHTQSGGASVALAVEDMKKAIAHLKKKGVKIVGEPRESGGCWTAMIADPDNNLIILHQRKDGTFG